MLLLQESLESILCRFHHGQLDRQTQGQIFLHLNVLIYLLKIIFLSYLSKITLPLNRKKPYYFENWVLDLCTYVILNCAQLSL